jgi:hypothetical protein
MSGIEKRAAAMMTLRMWPSGELAIAPDISLLADTTT